ncbi:MAG: SDR family oxidoreductase [Candidatus Omnitrophica bacterium]|nr:SDR family oxidoreductase [Candidatus Omnitrophota bacterium]MDE2010281.1 SDR family oxidoreductase [Candidatus Omnitrophota bacterium]MDE2215240.1 SDR family oxidoreductase [Candidatus Omnitrophota bacterium]MDE2231025.1 SDR family oxidoreductase [Candidatus Omnitrophota bacterium]
MSHSQVDLKGKTVMITGASRGIGRAIATRIASHGGNLVLAARTPQPLEELVGHLKDKYGIQAIGVPTDVGKLDDLKNLVDMAKARFKQIDVLINVAGRSSQYLFHQQPIEELEMLANTNYLGYVRLIRLVVPDMVARKNGHIISVVSGSTLCDPIPRTFLTYSSLKMGLRAFLKGLFWEMREHNIKVTSLLPGVVASDLTDHLKDVAKEQRDRLMDPNAVADMVSFALSVPANSCPLELAVINQLTTWTKPVIDYQQTQAK